jgi:hypothetical protein
MGIARLLASCRARMIWMGLAEAMVVASQELMQDVRPPGFLSVC